MDLQFRPKRALLPVAIYQLHKAAPAAILALLAGCGGEPPAAPEMPAVSEFIGSAACRSCHEAEFRDWQGSHHELAMQVADESTILGNFESASFEYFASRTEFSKDETGYFVKTENENGELQDYRVTHTFGVAPLQQYLVEFPGGRLQALPYAWDARPQNDGGQRWYHLYPDEHIEPGDELHWTGRLQNWNYMCAECHSTNLVMGYDEATDTYETTYDEISVGCEACHGPGAEHRDLAIGGRLGEGSGLAVDLADRRDAAWTMNLDTGIAERNKPVDHLLQQPESCGRCHSRRGVIATEYEYGRPLADSHRLALLDEHLYFADGQIQDEVYVYGSFVQSRMFRAGVTCSDCHNPHSGELHTGSRSSDVCAQCHLPAKFASNEHSHHELAEASCIDCHMASRTYMGVDDRHDHSFRIPRPDLSVAIETPNACNNCHSDETPAWAASVVAEWAGPDTLPKPHIGTAIAAGRSTPANAELSRASLNRDFASISRATALTLLAPPFDDQAVTAIESGLADADPLMRIAALRALQLAPAELRLQVGAQALADPVLGVRLAAAPVYGELRDLLPANEARAFGVAAEEYRTSNRMLANTPEALASLGNFELSMGDVTQGVKLFRDALSLAPDNALLRHSMGLVLVRAGERDDALAELRKAHELEPSNPRYVYVYGVALNSLGLNADALTVLQDARQKFPADFDIGWAVATMLRDAGEIGSARKVADELAAQFPDDRNVASLRQSLRSN